MSFDSKFKASKLISILFILIHCIYASRSRHHITWKCLRIMPYGSDLILWLFCQLVQMLFYISKTFRVTHLFHYYKIKQIEIKIHPDKNLNTISLSYSFRKFFQFFLYIFMHYIYIFYVLVVNSIILIYIIYKPNLLVLKQFYLIFPKIF